LRLSIKRRVGPEKRNPSWKSKYSDGRIGIRKLASRAQWTINHFEVDNQSGDLLGIRQEVSKVARHDTFIPASKLLHYRTTTTNNDPSGRSVLRNAYVPYTYLNDLQRIEAIAVERELHGVPVLRIPAEYLSPEATEDQIALKNKAESIARDLKLNEQGYVLLPSDLYVDADGNPTDHKLMDIELIASQGSRNVEIDPIIRRYQHDIARSIMAEFLMLGGGNTGSYALSKSKTDLFLRSMESYINTIFDVINKQLVERLWELNGLDYSLMPTIVPGDVAPHDLENISRFLRNLNGAGIVVSQHPEVVENLMDIAELDFDRNLYELNQEVQPPGEEG